MSSRPIQPGDRVFWTGDFHVPEDLAGVAGMIGTAVTSGDVDDSAYVVQFHPYSTAVFPIEHLTFAPEPRTPDADAPARSSLRGCGSSRTSGFISSSDALAWLHPSPSHPDILTTDG